MGIFEKDLVKKDPEIFEPLHSNLCSGLHYMVRIEKLSKEELITLLKVLSFDPNRNGIIYPRRILKPDTIIIISEEEKYYDGPSNILKLGEYCMVNYSYRGCETITLYINSIRKSASEGGHVENMLGYVFIHELYHAYFHTANPVKQLEEPLAELGALLFMSSFLDVPDEFKEILNHVTNKKSIPEICFYGFGADLLMDCVGDSSAVDHYISAYRSLKPGVDVEQLRSYVQCFPILYAADQELHTEDTKERFKKILGVNK